MVIAAMFAAIPAFGAEPEAGDVISAGTLAGREVAEWFEVHEIDGETFARMAGKSYKADCTVPLSELRIIEVLHCDFDGLVRRGKMVCNKRIADDLLAIFRALYDARYPIARMVPVDEYDADDNRSMEANNSSGFNFRRIAGTTALSKHSLGMAVDINPLQNPCVRYRNGRRVVEPESGEAYADRSQRRRGMISTDDLCYRLFTARGFTWGGSWRTVKDYQHFEKGE